MNETQSFYHVFVDRVPLTPLLPHWRYLGKYESLEMAKIKAEAYSTLDYIITPYGDEYDQPQPLHRPEHYVLQNPESSLVWQPSFFKNGSLHLAFSADDFSHERLLSNVQQFEVGEIVMLPAGEAIIIDARVEPYSHYRRFWFHIVYTTRMLEGHGADYDSYISEFELLDWDNYKDPMATDLYRSFQKYYLGGIKVETPYVEKPVAKKWCQSCTDQGIGSDWKLTREGWLCADCFYTKNEEYKETGESILTVIMDGVTYYKLANKE